MNRDPTQREWREACEGIALVLGCSPDEVVRIDFPPDPRMAATVHLDDGTTHRITVDQVSRAKTEARRGRTTDYGDSVRDELLRRMSEAMGTSYEDMSRDYRRARFYESSGWRDYNRARQRQKANRPPPRNPDHALFRVGDIVSRDGTDWQRITSISNDVIGTKCIKEPSDRWCRLGDVEDNMASRYHYPKELTLEGEYVVVTRNGSRDAGAYEGVRPPSRLR